MNRTKLRKAYLEVVIATILASVAALVAIWNSESGYRDSKNEISQVDIIGEYYLDDSSEALPLTKDTHLDLKGKNTLTIHGRFSKEILKNRKVMLRINNLKVHIEINGETVYSFGEHENYVEYAKSPGNLWDSFVSDGIKTTDEVKIVLTNVYTDRVNFAYKQFLNNIYYGNDNEFVKETLRDKIFNCFLAVMIICMGIFAAAFMYVSYRLKHPIRILACFSGLSISSGIWFFIDFEIQNVLFPSPVFNNSLDMICMMFTSYFVLCFVAQHIKSRWRHILRLNGFCFILCIQFATVMQFLGVMDYYETYPAMYAFGTSGALFVAAAVIYEWHRRRNKAVRRLMITSVLLAAGAFADLVCIYTEIIPYMYWFRIAILFFLLVEFIEIVQIIKSFISESARVSMLEDIAYKDALTGVKNRTAYLEKIHILEKKIENKLEFALIVFDINDLKLVNDREGHEQGDHLIQRACNLMGSVFEKSNVYRIGGDEFVAVLEGKYCNRCSERLLHFEKCCKEEGLAIAYGMAGFNAREDHCFHNVFIRADQAMYETKKRMKDDRNGLELEYRVE